MSKTSLSEMDPILEPDPLTLSLTAKDLMPQMAQYLTIRGHMAVDILSTLRNFY